MSFERSYSIESQERIKKINFWRQKPTYAEVGHICCFSFTIVGLNNKKGNKTL